MLNTWALDVGGFRLNESSTRRAVVGVIVRRGKRGVGGVFEVHPAVTTRERGMSKDQTVTLAVGVSPCKNWIFSQTEELVRRGFDSLKPDQLWSTVGRATEVVAALEVSKRCLMDCWINVRVVHCSEWDTRAAERCSGARVKKDGGRMRGIVYSDDIIVGVGTEVRKRAGGGEVNRG